MDPIWSLIVVAGVAVFAITSLWHVLLRQLGERRDMLDRIQSPDLAGYHHRKQIEASTALTEAQVAQALAGVSSTTDLQSQRPWEQDPEYAGCDFSFDHENNLVQIIDSEQDLVRVDLDSFMARYR